MALQFTRGIFLLSAMFLAVIVALAGKVSVHSIYTESEAALISRGPRAIKAPSMDIGVAG